MFPKNWSLERIQEEVAWVYEQSLQNKNMIRKESTPISFGKIEGETTAGFKIIVEYDTNGKIMNSYPKL